MVRPPPLVFEVRYDEHDPILIGQDDWALLSMTLNAQNDDNTGEISLDSHLGGLTRPDSNSIRYHFRWKTPELRVGSTVLVRVLASDDFVQPTKRHRSDFEVQENPFTVEEMRDMRYQDYLSLKAEFEH